MKKTITMLLAIILTVGLFAACSPSVPPVVEDDKVIDAQPENKEENLPGENEPEKEEIKNESVKNEETKNEKPDKNEPSKEENKKPEEDKKPAVKEEKKVSDIAASMVSVIPSDLHNLEAMPQDFYKDIYGIDSSLFEEVIVYGTMINVKANEIIVIKVKNEGDIATAKSVLEARKQQVYKTWEQYLPDQFEMVKQGVIKASGKYAALIISPEVSRVASQFESLTK